MNDLRGQLLAVYADEHRDHLAALRAAFTAPTGVTDLEEAYRHAHSLKGAARAVDVPLVEALAHGLETLLQAVWDDRLAVDEPLRRLALRTLDAIEDVSARALADQPMPAAHPVLQELNAALTGLGLEAVAAPQAQQDSPHATPLAHHLLRVDTESADRLLSTTARLLAELDAQREALAELSELGDSLVALRRACTALQASAAKGELADLSDRADSVLLRHEEAMRKLADREWKLALLSGTLRDDVARLRMVSADSVLGGFGPMVREIAGQQGKQVSFTMEGMSTMGDRDVLQPLADGVVHLLRNAVTHGLEIPSERSLAGKDPVGSLVLSVQGGGGRVVVAVRDDGRGIDPRAVGRAAARRGLIGGDEAENGDPDRLRMLLFESGVSTSEEVTAFAGRGMGLSIIRRLAGRLQGSVDLTSHPGRGTTISLTVPITVLAQRVLLAVTRGQTFGLPVTALVRLLAVARGDAVQAGGRTIARVDGTDLPLADLGSLLGLPGEGPAGDTLRVAEMRLGSDRLGLVVDQFCDVRDLPVAALEPPLADDPRLAGVATLEDGRLSLVLSPPALLPLAARSGPLVRPESRREPPLILVVDDSMTTRTLEKSILEAHGYRVALAVDGRDALAAMAGRRPDLVLSDVEMPNMDGFALLAEIRRHPDWRTVPVVLVTSRDHADDRARGMRLGADAYIVKTRFDQEDLLETIGRLA